MLLVRGKSFHFLKNLIYILFGLFNISLFLMSYSKCQEIGGPVEAFALDLKHEKQPESQKKNLTDYPVDASVYLLQS